MAAARNGNIYIEFYSSNNNVRRFLQLFSVLMLFIETINYNTGMSSNGDAVEFDTLGDGGGKSNGCCSCVLV